jgi:hypothetical protein
MVAEEEGMDFARLFRDQVGNSTFGKDAARTEVRLAAERKAGLTAKQRAARKKPPKKQNNFRASPDTLAQLNALMRHLKTTKTGVIATAIAMLAERELGAQT